MFAFINKVILIVSLISVYIMSFINVGYSLSTATHRDLNEHISKSSFSGFTLNDYLKQQLGMTKGYDEKINDKEIFKWIRDGGDYEDQPPRWMAHFHNPLTDKGLLGSASALIWAIAPTNAQTTFPPTGTGTYSWYDARYYFEQALMAKDKKARENYFALTFRSVGQVMHLVQDMSVPAHTRADIIYYQLIFCLEV